MNENNPGTTIATGTDQESPLDEDAPTTETERIIAQVWAEVLKFDEFDRHEDFFDLGGHSVLATQVAARLRVAFGRDIPERALFDWPTVATLAGAVPDYPASDQNAQVPLVRRRTSAAH